MVVEAARGCELGYYSIRRHPVAGTIAYYTTMNDLCLYIP
jgi:hypothetical protein